MILLLGFATLLPAQEHGKATYYSRRATGSRTASGEALHHDSMTCAHKTHPMGTMLKVEHKKSGRSVIVRVNDRGPYGRGRIIDLSYGAAQKLGIISAGVADVVVSVYDSSAAPSSHDIQDDVIESSRLELAIPDEEEHPKWRNQEHSIYTIPDAMEMEMPQRKHKHNTIYP